MPSRSSASINRSSKRSAGNSVDFNPKLTHLWSLDDELLNRLHKDAAHRCIERLAATVNFPADPTFAGGDKEVLIMEAIAKVLRDHRVHIKGIRQI